MAQDGPRKAQGCPKMAPRWPKIAPRWPQEAPLEALLGPSWGSKSGSQRLQKCAFRLGETLCFALGGHLGEAATPTTNRRAPGRPKVAQRWARMAPRWPHGGPNMAPRWPTMAPLTQVKCLTDLNTFHDSPAYSINTKISQSAWVIFEPTMT